MKLIDVGVEDRDALELLTVVDAGIKTQAPPVMRKPDLQVSAVNPVVESQVAAPTATQLENVP